MEIIFLGSVTDESEVSNWSGASIAGNKMQLNLIKGLMQQGEVTLQVISIPSIAAFPNDKNFFRKRRVSTLEALCPITYISFLNIPIIKQIWQIVKVYKEARKKIKQNKEAIIMSFNLYPQTGLPLVWLQKKYHCKASALLADLPIDDNYNKKSVMISVFNALTKYIIKQCKHLIVLNQQAIRKFNKDARFMVMEGAVWPEEAAIQTKSIPKCKNIVFGGRLIEYNGILNMLEAMRFVQDPEIRLDIYGSGPMEEVVKEYNQKDSRIRYMGKVSNNEMLQAQREAWLLINPRPVHDPIAEVTFPSKIFEYLLSGTPVLSTRLNGFTEEYEQFIYFTDVDTAESIGEKISKLSRKPCSVLKERACRAKDFVVKEKNWLIQTKKIKAFLGEL